MTPPQALHSKAIVLSRESFGESDRYVQFLTQKWGMITTLAKAARKSKRRYVGGLDLFCHDEIFVRGDPRDRPYLIELSVLNSFTGIRETLEKIFIAGQMLQWVRRLANVATPIPGIYSLLGQTLSLLESETDLTRLGLLELLFRLKLLSHLGLKPNVETCAKCGQPVESQALFALEAGGILCENCLPTTTLDESLFLDIEDRNLLNGADRFKLTHWGQFHFSKSKSDHLAKLITQFASYHTHVRLPI